MLKEMHSVPLATFEVFGIETVKPEAGTGTVRVVGSLLLPATREAWLTPFRIVRGTRKSLESKVHPPSAALLRRMGSLKSGEREGAGRKAEIGKAESRKGKHPTSNI